MDIALFSLSSKGLNHEQIIDCRCLRNMGRRLSFAILSAINDSVEQKVIQQSLDNSASVAHSVSARVAPDEANGKERNQNTGVLLRERPVPLGYRGVIREHGFSLAL